MIKFILLFFTYIKIALQSETLPEKVLDKGTDLSQIPKTPKKDKLYIYHRVKFPYNQNSEIPLFYGLDENLHISTNHLNFKIDLNYSKILINSDTQNCQKSESCKIQNASNPLNPQNPQNPTKPQNAEITQNSFKTVLNPSKIEKDGNLGNFENYKNMKISTTSGNTVLTINRIRPGELNDKIISDLDNLSSLKINFYKSEIMKENILGLAPNSEIWKYWENIYHFPKNHINMTFCYNEENEFLMFDSFINNEKEVLFKVKKNEEIFKFESFVNYNDKQNVINNQVMNICVNNKNDIMMSLNNLFFNYIKNAICKNKICVTKNDLRENPEIDFEMKIQSFQRLNDYFSTKFYLSSFLEILEDGKIKWKIEEINNQNCDIILQKEFLKEKYFFISNNLNDKDYVYIGFKHILPSDFSFIDFYNISMLVMSVISVALFVVYLILNSSLNKIIEKEEEIMKL